MNDLHDRRIATVLLTGAGRRARRSRSGTREGCLNLNSAGVQSSGSAGFLSHLGVVPGARTLAKALLRDLIRVFVPHELEAYIERIHEETRKWAQEHPLAKDKGEDEP